MRKQSLPRSLQKQINNYRRRKKKIGFVPTMGALHEGHLSLIRRARKECDVVVVSIFVNPTQFGPKEDFSRYPRTYARDSALLKKEKVDILFAPSVRTIYPNGFETSVRASSLASGLCGAHRPGHFDGVATVVLKLFNLVEPDVAYFGQKDYQQGRVIEQLVEDLHLPIRIVMCPIVREKDGLAMSSRNKYLKARDRDRARGIYEVLQWMKKQKKASISRLKKQGKARMKRCVTSVQYLEWVDPVSLQSIRKRQPKMVLACACFVGKTRLIDNVIIRA